ncbi:MAG TPA: amidohydrolase family protein [Casimicrobiaceae bacterium]|nr:amidohydrolase family protein [Casimicrobiaceae bacterium]
MGAELIVRGGRLRGGTCADILVRAGRVAAIGESIAAADGAEVLDAAGCVVLPGFVDAHAHVDKTLWGTPWHSHRAGPTVADRIANERSVLRELGLSAERQSARLVRHLIARGTTHVRTHVDVSPEIGLRHLHGVMAMRDAHREWIDMDIVAFPQSGVIAAPGTIELLDAAVREGAELIGGIDPIGIDGDLEGQLDAIFGIAERRGCGIDIHLHDRGEIGATTIEKIAERTRSLGLAGRVAVSHAFCLGMVEPARLDTLIDLLLRNDIAIVTHAPSGDTPFPPVGLLAERGVRLFSGSDGIRDAWSPLNTGDMLERAFLIAYRCGFRDDAGLELALRLTTDFGARVMGIDGYGLDIGCAADFVVVPGETAAEAVAMHPQRKAVVKKGRVVARDGRSLLPPVA